MTLLVALKGSDGLVLAADSRGTFGDPRGVTAQNDSQQKAHILSPHVGALQAGAGEVGALLLQEVASDLASRSIDGVSTVMEVLRTASRARYQDWFPSVPAIQPPALVLSGQVPARPDLSFIIAGYNLGADGSSAQPAIFQLASGSDFSPMLHDYGFAVAGVAQYALYLLNTLYEPGRSVEELTALAVYVITETAGQDGKVGGPVKVITIRADEGAVSLDDNTVSCIVSENGTRSRALRDSFYKRRQADDPTADADHQGSDG